MQINKELFLNTLSQSLLCPHELNLDNKREGKICGYSEDCKKCWNESFEKINNIEFIGGIKECQK